MGRVHVCLLVLIAGCGRFGFTDSSSRPDADDGIARITVERGGTMGGTIMGTDLFQCSASSCTLEVPRGTAVWLRAVPTADAWFAGWSGPCGGNFTCELAATGDVTVGAEFAPLPNRGFVTSTTTNGSFGGLAAGDAICTARANAAGLSGTFIAYLSSSTTDAASRLAASRGWVRVDGAPVADAPTAFSNGSIVFPPRLNEYGDDVGTLSVYTGTSLGAKTANRCLDWTSALATDNATLTRAHYAANMVNGSTGNCGQSAALLCVEIGRNVPVAIHPDPQAQLAFTSRTLWTPGNGRSSADAVCAADAVNAGLAGTFLAGLATTTESIESRFPPGRIYRRGDGVRLLRTAGIFSTDSLDVPPELDARGSHVTTDYWTGTLRWASPAQATQNCSDWSISSTVITGDLLYAPNPDLRNATKTTACNTALPVLCFEN